MTVAQVLNERRKSIHAIMLVEQVAASQAAEKAADEQDVKEVLRVLDFVVRF
jgi:hypothetical protein